jgi:hypothetical protein
MPRNGVTRGCANIKFPPYLLQGILKWTPAHILLVEVERHLGRPFLALEFHVIHSLRVCLG